MTYPDINPTEITKKKMALHSKIKELREMAKRRGGRCLSDTYVNCNTKLLWQCSKSHQWEAAPRNTKAGHWCPTCAIKKLVIDDLQAFVSKRGGCCLSDTYVNNKTKLLWECSKGHRWEATPGNIKNGRWCPTCAGVKKLTIADMQKLAKKQGGRCLSGTYVNTKTKILWQCGKGHQWEAIPRSIIDGSWCPICFFEQQRNFKTKFKQCKRDLNSIKPDSLPFSFL